MGNKETSTSSIRIEPKLWMDFKLHCIKNKIAICKKLEELIKKELGK
jgi:hypothetical protein